MKYILDESKPYYRYFEDICRIPHGSGNEKALSDMLVAFARERGLWVFQDEALNVIIKKPASAGYEDAAPLMLQAHIDMVCEKNEGVEHDFLHDPLDLYLDEDGWLRAHGTTLGADDGSGVATMMAILDDNTLSHPMLECVFTVEEETGMGGAAQLRYNLLTARRMVGLDSAGETGTTLSSAGGLRLHASRSLRRQELPENAELLRLKVSGLEGGHSGIFIDKERGNSIKILARLLDSLRQMEADFILCDLRGGSKDNAIPREASAVIACCPQWTERIRDRLHTEQTLIAAELSLSDKAFSLELESAAPMAGICPADTKAILDFLCAVPNGIAAMSLAIPGLVMTSDNVGVSGIEQDVFYTHISLRSSSDSRMDELCRRISLICALCGMEYSTSGRYPGMDVQLDSPFRDRYGAFMKQVWGKDMRLSAGHAGGEGGYFVRNLPGMEMVNLGPFIEDVHSPDEKMDPVSFERCYLFLTQFMASLKE